MRRSDPALHTELNNIKGALEENVIAGEQLGAATHRKLYNDKIHELINTEKNTEMYSEKKIVEPLHFDRLRDVAEVPQKMLGDPA